MLMKSLGGTTEESKDKVAAAFPNLEMRAGLRHALSTRPSCTHCVRSRHLQDVSSSSSSSSSSVKRPTSLCLWFCFEDFFSSKMLI